jgi:hypothetical protein
MISRSIFDPGNPNVERSGNTMTPAEGRNYSKMPEDVIDGVIEEEETAEFGDKAVEFDAAGQPAELPPDEDGQAVGETAVGQVEDGGLEEAAAQGAFGDPEAPPRERPGR